MSRSRSCSETPFSDDELFMILTHVPQILDMPSVSNQKLHVVTSTLRVTVFSTARPECTWLRMVGNGRETVEPGMRRLKTAVVETAEDIYECSLTIEKPSDRLDSGFYVCRIENDGGTVEADFDFDYSEMEKLKPKLTGDPKMWLIKNEDGLVDVHLELDFHSNYGAVEVTWDPPSWLNISDPAFRTETVEEGNGNYKTCLDIVNFNEQDHDGYYRCIVHNDAGENSHCFSSKNAEFCS